MEAPEKNRLPFFSSSLDGPEERNYRLRKNVVFVSRDHVSRIRNVDIFGMWDGIQEFLGRFVANHIT